MAKRRIYHGSNQYFEYPIEDFVHKGATDYGRGFYCTEDIESAKEWACKLTNKGFLIEYEIDDTSLKVLDLTDKNRFTVLNWFALLCKNREFSSSFKDLYQNRIDFIIKNYLNVNIEEYDVVIGYRADDAYFNFPINFINGQLTLEVLEKVFSLGNLGKQYVLISHNSYKCLKHIKTIDVEPKYMDIYKVRIDVANKTFNKILKESILSNGTRITELMKNDK